MTRRGGCHFPGCRARAEYEFDPNLGVAPPQVMRACAQHVAQVLADAFALQAARGDRWISLNIEPIMKGGRHRPIVTRRGGRGNARRR